jgi:hypothetical protein
VTYSLRKVGRSVTGVTFRWHWRDPGDAARAAEEVDRHSIAATKPVVTNVVAAIAPPLIEGDDAAWAWSILERVLGSAWAKAWGPGLTVQATSGVVKVTGSPLSVSEVRGHGQLFQAKRELSDAGWTLEIAG